MSIVRRTLQLFGLEKSDFRGGQKLGKNCSAKTVATRTTQSIRFFRVWVKYKYYSIIFYASVIRNRNRLSDRLRVEQKYETLLRDGLFYITYLAVVIGKHTMCGVKYYTAIYYTLLLLLRRKCT